jgi:hypothetical protein
MRQIAHAYVPALDLINMHKSMCFIGVEPNPRKADYVLDSRIVLFVDQDIICLEIETFFQFEFMRVLGLEILKCILILSLLALA